MRPILSTRSGVGYSAVFGGSRCMAFQCDLSRFAGERYDWSLPYIVRICTSLARTSCILVALIVPAR